MKSNYIYFGALLFVVLILLAIYLKKRHLEGFTSDSFGYEKPDLTSIQNPILKIMKKIGHMSSYLANPTLWKNAYAHSKMSAVELARIQIAKDKKEGGK